MNQENFPDLEYSLTLPLSKPMMFSLLTHIYVTRPQRVYTLSPGDAYTVSALVETIVYLLFGTKPLPETTLTYCQLGPQE